MHTLQHYLMGLNLSPVNYTRLVDTLAFILFIVLVCGGAGIIHLLKRIAKR